MSFSSIVMTYKENCKAEGEIMTKFKIARMFFAEGKKQKELCQYLKCHKNTVYKIIAACRGHDSDARIWRYLIDSQLKIAKEELEQLFSFFKYSSRSTKRNKRSIQKDSDEEKIIIDKFEDKHWGSKRMFKQLRRQGYDHKIYTLGKIKGVYKRKKLKGKKVRTFNGERRALYNYDEIEAFEFLQYDTKEIVDTHALSVDIYEKFKNSTQLPRFQWTIVDAKTKVRFLAWSRHLSSLFGFQFMLFVIIWLRSHGVRCKINIQMDMGGEFYSGSKRKQKVWNEKLKAYNVHVYDTEGVKWKQNLVERTHRIDDEEFYCPRGNKINTKTDFMIEAQFWIHYYNNRLSDSIGLSGISPKEKLEQLGFYNARQICNFPCLILEDYFQPFMTFFNLNTAVSSKLLTEKSHYVLTPYLFHTFLLT